MYPSKCVHMCVCMSVKEKERQRVEGEGTWDCHCEPILRIEIKRRPIYIMTHYPGVWSLSTCFRPPTVLPCGCTMCDWRGRYGVKHLAINSTGNKNFSGGSVVKTPPSNVGVWVPFLVEELRSHMPCSGLPW